MRKFFKKIDWINIIELGIAFTIGFTISKLIIVGLLFLDKL
jgi:hypothetical protein